jgi:signal transduction histidine kinase
VPEGRSETGLVDRLVGLFRRFFRARRLVPQSPEGQRALITALDVVAAAISSARSVHEVLGIIVDAAKRFTGTEKVIICLVDEYAQGLTHDSTTLVVRGARDAYTEEWWSARLPDIVGDTFADGRPYFDVDQEAGAWLLAVPIRVHDQPLGILVAINAMDHGLLEEHTAFLAILGAFSAASIANARLAEESRWALLASERERIAREMHDGIAQSLFSISLGLEVCKKQVYRDPPGVADRLDELQCLLESSMGELRRYIYDLRPAKLQELGLNGAIEYWLQHIAAGDGLHARLEVRGAPRSLAAESEACLYRVAREAVTNAVKHARASTIVVSLEYADDAVTVLVEDDGSGFDVRAAVEASENGSTVGLRSLTDRLRSAGGSLAISSAPGGGSRVRGTIPF